MKTLQVALILLISWQGFAKRYCKDDVDCSDLGGDLHCIKSMCDWGVCGCSRGHAARYTGHHDRYQCVKMKRIGEKCTTYGDHGVCAAEDSFCDQDTNRCVCVAGKVPVWGGEKCALDRPDVGETCSSSMGSCLSSSCESPDTNSYWHNVVVGDVPTCACSNNERLHLVSSYFGQHAAFIGRRMPVCMPARIGEFCLKNADCPGNSLCSSDKKCTCTTGMVPNYWRTHCDTALSFGTLCSSVIGHCDGTQGLVCGETCDLAEIPVASTCTCGPSHSKSGSSCTPILEGDSCYGDGNCKWFSDNGICDGGVCTEDE